jgi:heme exporter protein B
MKALFFRELKLLKRNQEASANPLIFFVLLISLFPLGVAPDGDLLKQIAPGIIWIGALLASVTALDSLFKSDFEDGSLQQMLLAPGSQFWLLASKVLVHWLSSGFPVVLLAPILGLGLGLGGEASLVLTLSLLLGTPLITLIGAIGAALTVGLRQGGALLSLMVLPLYVPALIFGTQAVVAAMDGLPFSSQLFLLASQLVLAATLAPWAILAALRLSAET